MKELFLSLVVIGILSISSMIASALEYWVVNLSPIREIVLTFPITQTTPTRVRVSYIGDHPNHKQISIRLTVGYVDGKGDWIEVKNYHELIKNTPASPKYDDLINSLKTSGKTAEEFILNRAKTKFPGIMQ